MRKLPLCCQPGEIKKNGICTACPPRHIPDDDQPNQDSCKACNPDQIAIGDKCESCPAGHVPINVQNECVACILPKIAKAGNCTSCPLGQIPMNNQTICIETNSKWFLLPGQTISQAIYNLESFNRSLNFN